MVGPVPLRGYAALQYEWHRRGAIGEPIVRHFALMKTFAILLLIPFCFCGCVTKMAVEGAKHNPADALLLPLAVSVDLIGYPIEQDMC